MHFRSSALALRLTLALLLTTPGLLLTACGNSENTAAANIDYTKADEALIQKYLADNKITTAQRQPSGLYYVPNTPNPTGTPATEPQAPLEHRVPSPSGSNPAVPAKP